MSGFPITNPQALTQQRQKLLSQLQQQYANMVGGSGGSSAWQQGVGSPFTSGLPHVGMQGNANLWQGILQGLGAAQPRDYSGLGAPDMSNMFRGASAVHPSVNTPAPDMQAMHYAGPVGSSGAPPVTPGQVTNPYAGLPNNPATVMGNTATGTPYHDTTPGMGVLPPQAVAMGAGALGAGLVPLGNDVFYDPSNHTLTGNTSSLGSNAGSAARGVGMAKGSVIG